MFELIRSCLRHYLCWTYARENLTHDPNDQGKLKIQCENHVPADDLMAHIQFAGEGWEIKGGPEGSDTFEDDGNMF